MRAYDPSTIRFPAGVREPVPTFGRVTIRVVHAAWLTAALFLWLCDRLAHSALLTPIDPNLRAGLIGAGVFVGCVVAFVERDRWALGPDGGRSGPPQGIAVAVVMLLMVAASGFGGHLVAQRWWDWQAFHAQTIDLSWEPFTVIGADRGRYGTSVTVRAADGTQVGINCSRAFYRAVSAGKRVLLPVETGRGGARRVSLPPVDRLRPA